MYQRWYAPWAHLYFTSPGLATRSGLRWVRFLAFTRLEAHSNCGAGGYCTRGGMCAHVHAHVQGRRHLVSDSQALPNRA